MHNSLLVNWRAFSRQPPVCQSSYSLQRGETANVSSWKTVEEEYDDMGCCSSLEDERNGEKARRRTEHVSSPTPLRTLRNPQSSLFLSFLLSLPLLRRSSLLINTASLAKKEENESEDGRRERAEGEAKEVKRNCFWQSTTATDDNDADAARHEYEDASQRFVRRDAVI